MKHYLETTADVIKECQSKREGLSESEAESRLIERGKNRLEKGKKKSLFRRFAEQIADPMVLVLLGAAIVSSVTIYFNNITNASDSESYADVFIILAVVILTKTFVSKKDRFISTGTIGDKICCYQLAQIIEGLGIIMFKCLIYQVAHYLFSFA